MPKHTAALQIADIGNFERRSRRYAEHKNEHAHANDDVQKVNSGEHKIERVELVRIKRCSSEDTLAVIERLDHAKPDAAGQRRKN